MGVSNYGEMPADCCERSGKTGAEARNDTNQYRRNHSSHNAIFNSSDATVVVTQASQSANITKHFEYFHKSKQRHGKSCFFARRSKRGPQQCTTTAHPVIEPE